MKITDRAERVLKDLDSTCANCVAEECTERGGKGSGCELHVSVADSACDHTEMVTHDEPGYAWKCAKCGHVYGKPNTATCVKV